MAFTLTVDMCSEILEIASNGGDYTEIANFLGLTRQAISQWYRNSVGEDGDETFKGNPIYQLFAVAIEVGRSIYALKQVKRRISINKDHSNKEWLQQTHALLKQPGMSKTEQVEWWTSEMSIITSHGIMSGTSQAKIDQAIEEMRAYYKSLEEQVIKFGPSWSNPIVGRPRKNKSGL
jgi:predicted transcriptional regulator